MASSALTIVANNTPSSVPMQSNPPLKMSHALLCCVSALLLCTPKSSYTISGTLLCWPFIVGYLTGFPFLILLIKVGKLKTIESNTLSQSLYTSYAICSAKVLLLLRGGPWITTQR